MGPCLLTSIATWCVAGPFALIAFAWTVNPVFRQDRSADVKAALEKRGHLRAESQKLYEAGKFAEAIAPAREVAGHRAQSPGRG